MSAQDPHDVVTASVGSCPVCGADLLAGDRFCAGCGAPVPEPGETKLFAELRQATLGEHEILGILGRGGMGLVYLAHDVALNRKVAIKVLPPAFLEGGAAVERFRREARIAASLRHRHITSVFGLKETPRLVFFIMEYIEGRTLDAILRDEGRLAIDVVEAIVSDVAGALSYAHRREVVHRDLKPANVIVDVEGMAMVTDFGVAKVASAPGLTAAGSMVGSPKYMSPEQWAGKATSFSDQYALGCVAFELLAGHAPFEGEKVPELMKHQMWDAPPPVREARPDCPSALGDAIMRMLEKEPAQRWPSLDAAVAAMGIGPVAADHPARQRLAQFAKRGHDVRALPRTPRSPMPAARTPPAPAAPRVPPRRAPARAARPRPRPAWPWALGAVVIAGAGVFLVWRALAPASGASPVATIDVDGVPPDVAPGDRAPLVVKARDAAGRIVAAPIRWSSSDSSVAFVSGDSVLVAVVPGRATLTATSGSGRATLTVTVAARQAAAPPPPPPPLPSPEAITAPRLVALEVRPLRIDLRVGESERLGAVTRDERNRAAATAPEVWTTSDPTIATVSAAGVVTGVSPGTARITAMSQGLASPSATVTVGAAAAGPAVLQILVNPWAYVFVDGAAIGQQTRAVDTLAPGRPHRMTFSRDGYVTVDTTVTLPAGTQRLLRIQLTPRTP